MVAEKSRYRLRQGAAPAHRWLSYRRIGRLSSEPEEQPYVLYALHIDPEASTMVKAPWHTNQLSVIEQASKALPPGWKLVVKENLPCIGIRPEGFYDEIERFHNVRLLPPAANTGEWMDRSRIVLSITGTVAWEALIKGKPVVLVGETELSSLSRHLVYEPDLGRLAPSSAACPDAAPDFLCRAGPFPRPACRGCVFGAARSIVGAGE